MRTRETQDNQAANAEDTIDKSISRMLRSTPLDFISVNHIHALNLTHSSHCRTLIGKLGCP